MPTKNVNLTDHYSQFVEQLVASGQYKNASEVFRARLSKPYQAIPRDFALAGNRYQTTDDHFRRAVEATLEAKQTPNQQTTGAVAAKPDSATEIDPNKAKQNPKQLVAVLSGGESHRNSEDPEKTSQCASLRYCAQRKADGEGFEPTDAFRRLRFSRPVQ